MNGRVFTMLAAALVVVGGLAWISWPEKQSEVMIAAPAQVAEEVKRQPRTEIAPKKVKAYPQKVKVDLSLPVAALGNANEHVVAAAKVRADDRPHTLVTTLDAETGEVRSYDRPDPLPWFEVRPQRRYGVYAGVVETGEGALHFHVRQELARAKAVRLGGLVNAEFIQSGQVRGFVGVGVEF